MAKNKSVVDADQKNIVKQVCDEFDITQKDLSDILDVPQSTISRWQAGEIPKMAQLALEQMIKIKTLEQHLENVKKFYTTLKEI
ncbi:MAG: helix-turn-helix transcriptional regulator [Sulfurovaceae bacterium]|nr:helix-turn-helix transcriptional regulator [Sulfurovaceae bacterium]